MSTAAARTWNEAAFLSSAQRLSKAREAAAHKLSETVGESMQTLGMRGGHFRVACDSDATRPGVHGLDQINFLVAANPGQPEAPLADVASGGELSRISLAIQVATANCGTVPTLIFDEVDVGIGGGVAEIVGHRLRELANQFHTYYNAHQFIVEDDDIRNARLNLIAATRQVLANGLGLLGVSAPESM